MSFEQFKREQRQYRLIFFEAHGEWPHPCHFCGEQVDGRTAPRDAGAAIIHHLDHDHSNNAPDNLVAAHWGCHTRHHHKGQPKSPEQRAKQSAAMKGRVPWNKGQPQSPERRAKLKGRKPTREHRARISAALKGRKLSPEHCAKLIAARKGKRPKQVMVMVSCLKCRRELPVGGALARHHHACSGTP